jgi:hypothetical protein
MCRALTGSGHFCIRAIHHPFRLPVLLPGRGNWVRRIHLFKLNNRIDYHYSVWPALILSVYFVDFWELIADGAFWKWYMEPLLRVM